MNDHSTPSARASAPARVRRRGASNSTRAAARNEVKSHLDDPTYEALLFFKHIHGIESTSSALSRIAKAYLLGMVGMLPSDISRVSSVTSHNGPQI